MRCNLCGTMVAPPEPPRWRKQGFEIFQCRSCGLLFRGELPTAEELEAIYNVDYFHRKDNSSGADGYADYLGDGPEHRLTARHRVRSLIRLKSTGRLLDVGAAAGFFVDEARKAGWHAEGIDISREMSRHGREQMGLKIRTGLFRCAEYPARSFDVVTMWDYIEHSSDPASDLLKAAQVLRSGGLLMLSTGDAASTVARISGHRWHLLTPRHHNFFFTVRTLRQYLENHGFELVYAGHPDAFYSLRYIVYKLRTMMPRSRFVHALGNWVATHPIGEHALRLNLRDIVTIYARCL